MADRYTRKDADRCARRLAKALGKPFGNCHTTKNGKYKSVIGCWDTSYNPIYGGVVIREILSEGGGITEPLGAMRRRPREFCDTVNFAIKAINTAWKEGSKKRR